MAFTITKHSGPASITTGHWLVVLILCQAIGETVSNQYRLEIDIALLVAENFVGENGNVVACVGFARNMEVLLSILRELLEKEGEKGVDVFAGGDCVRDGTAGVGEADIDGLVKEDDACVGIPRGWIVFHLDVLVDGRWAEFHEQTR